MYNEAQIQVENSEQLDRVIQVMNLIAGTSWKVQGRIVNSDNGMNINCYQVMFNMTNDGVIVELRTYPSDILRLKAST